jgi:antitoxin YefM
MVLFFVPLEEVCRMAITASEARKNLFPLIEQVNADRAPVEITSKRGRAVLVAAEDWEAWQETAYLFRSPANARRLLDAVEALDGGRGIQAELDTAE